MAKRYWKEYEEGEVRSLRYGQDPPISSLVEALHGQNVDSSETIVLRGYLGRSDILKRALDYLERARSVAVANPPNLPQVRAALIREVAKKTVEAGIANAQGQAQAIVGAADAAGGGFAQRVAAAEAVAIAAGFGNDEAREVAQSAAHPFVVSNVASIDALLQALRIARDDAPPHVPWRLYLTPRLDCYVDFHRSWLIAYRREAKAERQDACTVWLRAFMDEGRRPIPYRLVYENLIGPTHAAWLDGDLVDNYVEQTTSSTAWGDQAGVYGGFRHGTGKNCLGS